MMHTPLVRELFSVIPTPSVWEYSFPRVRLAPISWPSEKGLKPGSAALCGEPERAQLYHDSPFFPFVN